MIPRLTGRLAKASAALFLTFCLLLSGSLVSGATGPGDDPAMGDALDYLTPEIAPLGAPAAGALAATCQGENGSDYNIADGWPKTCGPYVFSTIVPACGSCASASLVSSIVLDYTVRHTRVGDLQIWLCNGTGSCVLLWDRAGGTADDIIATNVGISAFNGQAVGQAWSLRAWDCGVGETGYIDWWRITIGYTPAILAAPALSSPANGSTTCEDRPGFCWGAVSGAENYYLQMDNNSDFSSPELAGLVGNVTCYTPATALAAGVRYWRVYAQNVACGAGPWSAAWSVNIQPDPPMPTLVSPANGGTTCDTTPSFCWNAVSGAAWYILHADNNADFRSLEVERLLSATCYTPDSALAPGTYYWRVWAVNSCLGISNDYAVWSVTLLAAPAAPALSSPANDSATCNTTPTFCWGAVSGATAYWLSVDNDSSFSSPEIGLDVGNVTCYTPATLLAPGVYYWEMSAWNSCWGLWSETRSFTVAASPAAPMLLSPANHSSTCDTTPRFCWSAVSGATFYWLTVDNDSNFASPLVNESAGNATCYTPAVVLPPGSYDWRVIAGNACGASHPNVGSFAIACPTATATATPTRTATAAHSPTPSATAAATMTPWRVRLPLILLFPHIP